MSRPLNRRDFLRLAGMLPVSLAAPRWTRQLPAAGAQKNVIIVVFDAWSAYNISLYGFPRQTMPNLERLARRAIVYRKHFAAGNFTTPGTASLLTGTYPWTHRAILKFGGVVAGSLTHSSIFNVFDDYYRIGYTHNPLAYKLMHQFSDNIDELVEVRRFLLKSSSSLVADVFKNDDDISNVGWVRNAKLTDGYGYSLFLSHLDGVVEQRQRAQLARQFPDGQAPWVGGQFFVLEDAMDWTARRVTEISQPFLGYFHFLPPHAPYRPPREFNKRFDHDGYAPLKKPLDEWATDNGLYYPSIHYDEFLLYVDQQFARLYDQLEKSGVLDNTWLVLTSDHGDLFERGIKGHDTEALYQPIIHIPLLIFEPGREQGLEIETSTSAVDIVPTLAHLTGHALPAWTEGSVLPPFDSAQPDADRSIYAVRAVRNDPAAALTNASIMQVKGRYKLVYHFGFGDLGIPDHARLFDLQADPEEMNELSAVQKDVAAALLKELKDKIAEMNRPFV